MPESDTLKGYAWGLAGTVCLSTVSILSKLAYRTVSRDTFMVTMYISGLVFAGGYIVATGRLAELIRFLGRERILPARVWLERAIAGKLERHAICLTFDDNLRCQYDVARPVLRDLGLTAFWFIPTAVLRGEPVRIGLYRQFRVKCFEDVKPVESKMSQFDDWHAASFFCGGFAVTETSFWTPFIVCACLVANRSALSALSASFFSYVSLRASISFFLAKSVATHTPKT